MSGAAFRRLIEGDEVADSRMVRSCGRWVGREEYSDLMRKEFVSTGVPDPGPISDDDWDIVVDTWSAIQAQARLAALPAGGELDRLQRHCFHWHEKDGEERRGKWRVDGTARAVKEFCQLDARIKSTAPCVGRGLDGRLWVYDKGVWTPGDRVIHEHLVMLLRDEYSIEKQRNTEAFLRGSSELPVIESLPASAWVNFPNGLLDWESGVLSEHDPKVLCTVQLSCRWNPEAECPRWLAFLAEALPADAMSTFQEIFGYLMLAGEPLHKAFMFNGLGRNGKGTALHVLEVLLGAENVCHISMQSLGGTRFASAGLFGKVANIVGDMSATFVRETDTFKSATGGDAIDAERKGRDAFSFTPFASHVFSTNKLPMFADSSPGFLDRWIVVPFPNTVPPEKRDANLAAKLCEPAELEGIARWGVEGLRRLMARGRFDLSPSLLAAKEEFAVAVNPVRAFLRECAAPDASGWVRMSDMYSLYRAWVMGQGRKGATKQEFYAEVETLGIERGKRDGYDIFKGLALTKRPEDLILEGIW